MAIENKQQYEVVAEDGVYGGNVQVQETDSMNLPVAASWSSDDEGEKGEGNSGYIQDPYGFQEGYVAEPMMAPSRPIKKKKKNSAKKGMFAVVVLLVIMGCVGFIAMQNGGDDDDGECDIYDDPAYAGFVAENPQSPAGLGTGHTIAAVVCCLGLGGLCYMGLCHESEADKEREARSSCTTKKCNSWMCTAWCWMCMCR